jgi:hypothetical protein
MANVDHQFDHGALGQVNSALDQDDDPGQNIPPTAAPETSDPALHANGKKRKRIAPTLITSEIDLSRNRDIPTAADDVIHNDPLNIEPGLAFIGEDGRKRLVPVRQLDGQPDEAYRYEDMFPTQASSVADSTILVC